MTSKLRLISVGRHGFVLHNLLYRSTPSRPSKSDYLNPSS